MIEVIKLAPLVEPDITIRLTGDDYTRLLRISGRDILIPDLMVKFMPDWGTEEEWTEFLHHLNMVLRTIHNS